LPPRLLPPLSVLPRYRHARIVVHFDVLAVTAVQELLLKKVVRFALAVGTWMSLGRREQLRRYFVKIG
jgi:hypothetical protein